MKLLHIDSSILGAGSVSRLLSSEIVKGQRRFHRGLEVIYRDLAAAPLQHLSGAHLAARQAGTPPTSGLDVEIGGNALAEFLSAEIIVFGLPMYNFSVPTQFKAWVDRISIAGITFRYTEKGPIGLAGGKKVFVASSRGGAYTATDRTYLDHQESYVKAALGFMGITDITIIRAENTSLPDLRDKSIESARKEIAEMSA